MRKLIATVFNYSLDGLLADEGTEFWDFCFDLPENREPDDPAQLDFLQSASGSGTHEIVVLLTDPVTDIVARTRDLIRRDAHTAGRRIVD